ENRRARIAGDGTATAGFEKGAQVAFADAAAADDENDGEGVHESIHQTVQPPSTTRLWPVTKEAASERRNRTGPTISSLRPMRPSMVRWPRFATNSGWVDCTAGLGNGPGVTQLQRTPS